MQSSSWLAPAQWICCKYLYNLSTGRELAKSIVVFSHSSSDRDVCMQCLLVSMLLVHMACPFLPVQAVGSGLNEQHEPVGGQLLASVHKQKKAYKET